MEGRYRLAGQTNLDKLKMDVGYDDRPRAIAGEGVAGPYGRSCGSPCNERVGKLRWGGVDINTFALRKYGWLCIKRQY